MLKSRKHLAVAFLGTSITAALVIASAFHAKATEPVCWDGSKSIGNLSIQSINVRKSGKCVVFVGPKDHAGIYRRYAFASTGALQAFSSYAEGGKPAKTTSARVYFFFPCKQNPTLTETSTGDVEVTTASGETAHFSASSGRLLKLSGSEIWEEPAISRTSEGGLNIFSARGLYLDTGFSVGEVGYTNPSRKSTFWDPYRTSCEVRNSEIFVRLPNGEREPKHNDAELAEFLKKRCPKLDISSLLPPAPLPVAEVVVPPAPVAPVEPQPQVQPQAESLPESPPQSQAETQPQPEIQPQAQPEVQPQAETSALEPQSESQPSPVPSPEVLSAPASIEVPVNSGSSEAL